MADLSVEGIRAIHKEWHKNPVMISEANCWICYLLGVIDAQQAVKFIKLVYHNGKEINFKLAHDAGTVPVVPGFNFVQMIDDTAIYLQEVQL